MEGEMKHTFIVGRWIIHVQVDLQRAREGGHFGFTVTWAKRRVR